MARSRVYWWVLPRLEIVHRIVVYADRSVEIGGLNMATAHWEPYGETGQTRAAAVGCLRLARKYGLPIMKSIL